MTLEELIELCDSLVDLLLDDHDNGRHEHCGEWCEDATTVRT